MRCQLCGKDIPEGKNLCDECEKKRQEYLNTKAVSNNNDEQPEIVRPTDVLVTEVKVKSVEQKTEEKKEPAIKLTYQEKIRLLWIKVIAYTVLYSLVTVALFFPGLSEYFPGIIFEIFNILGSASVVIIVIISFVVWIKIFNDIRTIIKEDFTEYKKPNLLFYIFVIYVSLLGIVNNILSGIIGENSYSIIGMVLDLNVLFLTISAALVFGLERKYKFDLKDSNNKKNALILLIIILLIIYLIIYILL